MKYPYYYTSHHFVRFAQKDLQHFLYFSHYIQEMFVPCIIRHSSNNQHYTLLCTTPLFCILAPTCFGSSLPSSGSFLDPSQLLEIQIEYVVYHMMCGYVTYVPEAHRQLLQILCTLLLNQVHSFSAADTYNNTFSHRNLSIQHLESINWKPSWTPLFPSQYGNFT
jgi:hypothetical protein